ncbi:MAG: GNAT family N-acetyltransferase [Erysipelotrichaceae bacterium]|nr:GNAT family N-acetyltransferase [Erysipelotrichaceae bacterium]
MIKLTNLTKEELHQIGVSIGEAFYDEGEGSFTMLPRNDAIQLLEIMVEYYYHMGLLYTLSENQEGYVAFWYKHDEQNWGWNMIKAFFKMIYRYVKEIPYSSLKKVIPLMNNPYEKIYANTDDYVVVSMLVVKRKYQGQGFMRELLKEPFQNAIKNNIPCILDTDTMLKVQKYQHLGMTLVEEHQMLNGQMMYTLEYRA